MTGVKMNIAMIANRSGKSFSWAGWTTGEKGFKK